MEQYWTSYASFASAQSNVLSKNTIQKESYIQPQQSHQQPMDDYKDDNNYNNNNNTMPPQHQHQHQQQQQQQQQQQNDDDGDYEYYDDDQYIEENENGPTDDYNPFGE